MYTLKSFTFILFMAVGLLLSQAGAAQLIPIYIDPTHNASVNDYNKQTKSLITKINLASAGITVGYKTTAHNVKRLEQLKHQQYEALTTAYEFYKDSARIERFKTQLDQVRENLKQGKQIIADNQKANYLFADRMDMLLRGCDSAEELFNQATEVEGHEQQMTNGDRNGLLLAAEDSLSNIGAKGQKLVNTAKMLVLNWSDAEQRIKRQELYQWEKEANEAWRRKREQEKAKEGNK